MPLGDAARRRARGAGGARRARAGAGRERARGRGRPGARRARARGARTSRSSARSCSRCPTAWPPAASSRSRRSRSCARTRRRSGSASAGWPSTCRRRRPCRRSRPRTPCARSPRTQRGTLAAIGPRLAARRYGAVMLAEELEDDPGNATRFAWLAPVADAPPPPETGPAKTALVFWGDGIGRLGLARVVPGGVRVRGRRTSPGSSPGRCAGAWASTCSSSTSRARWPTPRSPGPLDGLRTHAEVVRVLG